MKFLEKKLYRNLALGLILFIGLVLALVSCRYHADKLLIDDLLSFSLSNTPNGWVSHEVLGWIDNSEFKRFAVLTNRFDFVNLWSNQARDCHPPLFYLVIHIISSIFYGDINLWYGYIPNIIYFLITGFFVYKLVYKLVKRYDLALLTTFLYVINPKVLEYVAFIRMYPMVGMFAIMFAYFGLDFLMGTYKKSTYIIMTCICALGCLTHYYSYVIYFFISLVIGLYLLYKKSYKNLIMYCVSILLGIGLALMVFPYAINHWITNPHSINAINNLQASNTLERYHLYLMDGPYNIYLLVALILILILWTKSKFKGLPLNNICLLFTSVAYFLLVGKTSSFITHRYMVPIDAICIVVITTSAYILLKKSSLQYLFGFLLILLSPITIYIKDYQNPISFAKANYGKLAIVYSSKDWDSNYINVNAFEFREYENIYLTNNSLEAKEIKADFFLYKDALVYVGEGMDLKEVKRWLFGSSRFTKLEETPIQTSIYKVYYASE